MKKMQIFEPAMCCETGLCGVSVNPELLRISTVLSTLKKNDIIVARFNLSNAPMEFVTNRVINQFINESGVDGLPAIVVDEKIIMTGRYPTNEELAQLLDLPKGLLNEKDAPEECCCCDGDDESCFQ